MQCRYRGLQLILSGRFSRQDPLIQFKTRSNPVTVPPGTVLILEGDHLASSGETRSCAGRMQQHERGQAFNLRLIGQQVGQYRDEANGFLAQVGPEQLPIVGRVPLREDQVDHGKHSIKTLRHRLRSRNLEGNIGLRNLVPGPDEALCHGVV